MRPGRVAHICNLSFLSGRREVQSGESWETAGRISHKLHPLIFMHKRLFWHTVTNKTKIVRQMVLWLLFLNWTQSRVAWAKETSIEELDIHFGHFSSLMMDVGRPNPLWVVPPQGQGAWVLQESKLSRPWGTSQYAMSPPPLPVRDLHFSFSLQISALKWCLGFSGWCTETYKPHSTFFPKFTFSSVFITTTEEN